MPNLVEHAWHFRWFGIIGGLGILDAWREREDIKAGRNHSNGTTLSASVRWAVETIPFGRIVFPFLCWLIPHWFEEHIEMHLDQKLADW